MPTRSLTVPAVERLKPPTTGQVDHFDQGFPGLALRISYGGVKSWAYVFRQHGKLRRVTLGRYPSMDLSGARDAWRDARKLVDKGEDPARPKPKNADSFEVIADDWLKRDQGENRSHDEVKRVIDRDVKPEWGHRQIASIGKRDVLELIDGIADRGAMSMARRTHTHLHRLFKWSVGRGILDKNPMTDLPKPGEHVKRDRVLKDDELVLIYKAAAKREWPFGPIVRLLILTGTRREEMGALCWSEIRRDTIHLQGDRTKNGKPHDIPLSPQAQAIIGKLPHVGESEFVFTTNGKTPVSGWSKAHRQLVNDVNKANGKDLKHWTIHDLRRTVATGLQKLGVALVVTEQILGHVGGSRAGVVGIYQTHKYEKETRAALDAWGKHVVGLK